MELQENGLLPLAAIEQAVADAQRRGTPPHEVRQLARQLLADAIKAVACSTSVKVISLRPDMAIPKEPEPTRQPVVLTPCPLCGKHFARLAGHMTRTHGGLKKAIPAKPGMTCDYGCGKPAKFITMSQRPCCCQNGSKCSAQTNRRSEASRMAARAKPE